MHELVGLADYRRLCISFPPIPDVGGTTKLAARVNFGAEINFAR